MMFLSLTKDSTTPLPTIRVYLLNQYVGVVSYTQFAKLISRYRVSQNPADLAMAEQWEHFLTSADQELVYTSDLKLG